MYIEHVFNNNKEPDNQKVAAGWCHLDYLCMCSLCI